MPSFFSHAPSPRWKKANKSSHCSKLMFDRVRKTSKSKPGTSKKHFSNKLWLCWLAFYARTRKRNRRQKATMNLLFSYPSIIDSWALEILRYWMKISQPITKASSNKRRETQDRNLSRARSRQVIKPSRFEIWSWGEQAEKLSNSHLGLSKLLKRRFVEVHRDQNVFLSIILFR